MTLKNKLLLASGSPRRRELIAHLFENNQVIKPAFDEPAWDRKALPQHYLETCLEAKWAGAAQEASRHPWFKGGPCCLLVADTIVVLGKKVLGKPASSAEARQMLAELSGKTHIVPTGLLLGVHRDGVWKRRLAIEETRVSFRRLSRAEIAAYVKSGEPMDKAGAYGFQAKGVRLIERIEGSYTNVIGLPLQRLALEASNLGLV
jgi:septum formation protein